jgi:hypothetical protein
VSDSFKSRYRKSSATWDAAFTPAWLASDFRSTLTSSRQLSELRLDERKNPSERSRKVPARKESDFQVETKPDVRNEICYNAGSVTVSAMNITDAGSCVVGWKLGCFTARDDWSDAEFLDITRDNFLHS